MWNSFRGFPLAFLTILAFSATVQAPSVGLCQFPRISFPFIHSDTTEVTTKAGHRRSAPTVSQSSGRALFITYSPYASTLTGEGCMTLRESWYHCQLSSTGLKMFGNSSYTSVTECMAVSCFGEKNNITITVYAFASYWTLFFVCVFLLHAGHDSFSVNVSQVWELAHVCELSNGSWHFISFDGTNGVIL